MMAGYKTRSSWSAPDIQFDKDGRRIRPEEPVPIFEDGMEVCVNGTDACGLALGLGTCGMLCALRHPGVRP